jgi:hypothetical protein
MLIETALVVAVVTYCLSVRQAYFADAPDKLVLCYAGSVVCPMLGLVSLSALMQQGISAGDWPRYAIIAWMGLGWIPVIAAYQLGLRRRVLAVRDESN